MHLRSPRADRTRRCATAAALALALALAACGSEDEGSAPTAPGTVATTESTRAVGDPADTDTTTTSGVAAPGDTAAATTNDAPTDTPTDAATETATRAVTDYLGRSIEVPARPERVVSLDVSGTLNLALLGITPVSAPVDLTDLLDDDFRRFVPDGVSLDAYEIIGIGETISVEALAALAPDLIIGYDAIDRDRPDTFDTLSRIAPTVFYEFGNNGDWQVRAAAEAEIVGRTDEFEVLRQRYLDALAAVPDSDATVAFVRLEVDGGGTWRLEHPTASLPGSIATEAGLTVFSPDETLGELNPTGSFYPDLSAERLGALTADAIVVHDLSAFGQTDPLTGFDQNPLWSTLPAVREGRVTTLGSFVFNGGTYATAILTLEALTEVLDG
jgi:iron complex transport system substrate-binding protein